uniref:COP9 signalosome complex subunit 1 n=1 Tax=Cacopsylla melanoneura TaxID=428564 RepID=A0A8D9BJ36_9HEMI
MPSTGMHLMHNVSNVEPMQVDVHAEDNDNNEQEMIIVENASLDLESYANSYTGLARLFRLIYVADHCPTLRHEALRMAIQYVMQTYNMNLYTQLHRKLADSLSSGLPDVASSGNMGPQDIPTLDPLLIETKNKKAAMKLEKLDNDLKNYKSNSIKESIRRGKLEFKYWLETRVTQSRKA